MLPVGLLDVVVGLRQLIASMTLGPVSRIVRIAIAEVLIAITTVIDRLLSDDPRRPFGLSSLDLQLPGGHLSFRHLSRSPVPQDYLRHLSKLSAA